MKTLFKYYGPAILWALFVFMMCTIRLGSISESPLFFPGFDKLVHCGFFFVLVVFLGNGLIRQLSPARLPYKYLLLFTALAIFYGGVIELLQLTIFTWRDGEWNDLFADAIGAAMGTFSMMLTVNAMRYVKK